jgi:hypothetical protein
MVTLHAIALFDLLLAFDFIVLMMAIFIYLVTL